MSKNTIELKDVESLYKTFDNVEEVKKALRNVQSIKCRLLKQKGKKTYENELTTVLKQEQMLKEVKNIFEPLEKPVTMFTQEDVEKLNFDETIKAIKSIQSKKCNTQYLTDTTEYENAKRIETMLLEHKKNVKPVEETVVKKSTINDLLNEVENLDKTIDKETMIELLKKLL